MHKEKPKQESNQALLSRVTKEMDEPRMAESAREELEPDTGTTSVVSSAFGSEKE